MPGRASRRIFVRVLGNLLDGGPCEAYNSDLKIRIPANGQFTYPDALVLCGDPELFEGRDDVALNPVLIAEVWSRSTKTYDRGEKFRLYRSIPSLLEYLMVSQDEYFVEQWTLKDWRWTLAEYKTSESTMELVSASARIAIADIYRGAERFWRGEHGSVSSDPGQATHLHTE